MLRTMIGGPCQHYDCSNRNSFGYCKTTVCINEHYQQEQWGLHSTNKSENVVIKQQTNADRIRSMTDEELAVFLYNVWKEQDTFSKEVCESCGDTDIGCQPNCWLDWLKQEVDK